MKKILFALAVLALSFQAQAGENSYITVGAGKYDVLHNQNGSAEFRLEYRQANIWKKLYPSWSAMTNTEGAAYGVFSLNYEINLTPKILLTPFTGAGLYAKGNSKDLGGPIEFRSGLELAYELDNDYRVGVNFSHMSNASIYEHNPGVEALVLNLSIPY